MHQLLKKFFTGLLLLIIAVGFSGCKKIDAETQAAVEPFTLSYWSVVDGDDDVGGILDAFNAEFPHISVDYRKFRLEEYEDELINAFAEGRGPDVFAIHESWLRKYQSKLLPMPATLTMPYRTVEGGIKEEIIINLVTEPTFGEAGVKQLYVPAVAEDVVLATPIDEVTGAGGTPGVYGLPMAMDTMVMYYNRDLLNQAGIAVPPQNWTQFQKAVESMSDVSDELELLATPAGFGSANTTERSEDILALLMMQGGAVMNTREGNLGWDQAVQTPDGKSILPAAQALQYYTEFADPTKVVYTWNDEQELNSFEAFLEGETAFFFGYAYHLKAIKSRGEKLPYGIAPMPQVNPQAPVNYANYWVNVVSTRTAEQDSAWKLVEFMGTQEELLLNYLANTGKMTALNSLIEFQIEDFEKEVFVSQLATAKSWYNGFDVRDAEKYIREAISTALETENPKYDTIIQRAQKQIEQTMSR
jgi:multiple sugar transport system substrate-binding protein